MSISIPLAEHESQLVPVQPQPAGRLNGLTIRPIFEAEKAKIQARFYSKNVCGLSIRYVSNTTTSELGPVLRCIVERILPVLMGMGVLTFAMSTLIVCMLVPDEDFPLKNVGMAALAFGEVCCTLVSFSLLLKCMEFVVVRPAMIDMLNKRTQRIDDFLETIPDETVVAPGELIQFMNSSRLSSNAIANVYAAASPKEFLELVKDRSNAYLRV